VGQPAEAEPADWGPRVMRIEYCPASHLAGLYQHCDAFIQPSLYEGSGVTVLEAMRAGAPVVTSRTGGIEEVAGDTPIFFNPESTASIIAAYDGPSKNNPNNGRRASATANRPLRNTHGNVVPGKPCRHSRGRRMKKLEVRS